MILVYLDRTYDRETLKEMRDWCYEHCTRGVIPGTPPLASFYGDQMEFYESKEVPWRFEDQEDVTLFKLRWML